MKKVLITDFVHQHLIDGLTEMGYEVEYNKNITLKQTAKIISDYNGIIINSKTVMDRAMMDRATRLKFIGRLGSGLEIIDLAYAKEKKISVFNSPEGNRNAVAEHALGMLLALANNLIRADREVKDFKWNREKNRGFELEGKTIGIIGFGNTGSSFARVLSGFGVKVLAYDKYKKDYTDGLDHVKKASMNQLLKKADIISLHIPLTPDTLKMVDDRFFEKCKVGAILINTSRGKIIDIKALEKALRTKRLTGLCLDVMPNEKPKTYTAEEKQSYSRLFNRNNVLVSPHVAGWTHESLFKIADVLLRKIKKI